MTKPNKTLDLYLHRAQLSTTHEHHDGTVVELQPADTEPFREWEYSAPFFDEGELTLHGDDLPLAADEFIGVADPAELDYFFAYEG